MTSVLARLAALASLAVPTLAACAQRAPTTTAAVAATDFARVDSAVGAELRRTHTPGAAVALVSGDRVVYAKGFGTTSQDGGAPAVTPATLFRIASVTKVFTATTLVSLAESGRVDLEAPIGARLGEELPAPYRALTPHQLLSHTAGLTMGPIPPGGSDPAGALAAATRLLPARAVFAPAGETFSYSNLGYLIAGRLIEVAGGRSYAEQVRQSLLVPLGMTATTFDSAAAAARGDVARGFVEPAAGPGAPPSSGGAESWPFAGLYSSVLDLSRFAVAFVNGGRYEGRQVFSPATIARVAKPVAPYRSGEGDYGYGVRVYRHRGVDVVEHGGRGLDGFRSLLYMVPSRHVAVVVLANRAGRRPYDVADAALDALLPGALEPVAAAPPPVAMDSAEMARYVGRYASGMVVDVAVENGTLTLRPGGAAAGGAPLPIRKLADGRFVAGGEDAGGWLAFVTGPDGAVKYLHFNMRAFRRVGS
ncbi:MAG TPA: serine hydrolase domain-containing protein [Gemmatimonadaceae bacterium]|nr:serine hydrolase domain-containing protein [Gemmatimonadaceae bacterium]